MFGAVGQRAGFNVMGRNHFEYRYLSCRSWRARRGYQSSSYDRRWVEGRNEDYRSSVLEDLRNKRLRNVRGIAGEDMGICEQVDFVFAPLGWKSRVTSGSGQVRMRYGQPFRIDVVWGYRCCPDGRL